MSEVVTTVERNLRKTKAGVVTSNKGDKSITVKVERKVKHPLMVNLKSSQPNPTHMMKRMSVELEIL